MGQLRQDEYGIYYYAPSPGDEIELLGPCEVELPIEEKEIRDEVETPIKVKVNKSKFKGK